MILTRFDQVSLAHDRVGRDSDAEVALLAQDPSVRTRSFFDFHAEHVAENQDNLCVNSLCLPVYASPLTSEELEIARRQQKQESMNRRSETSRNYQEDRLDSFDSSHHRRKGRNHRGRRETQYSNFLEIEKSGPEYVTRSGRQTKRHRNAAEDDTYLSFEEGDEDEDPDEDVNSPRRRKHRSQSRGSSRTHSSVWPELCGMHVVEKHFECIFRVSDDDTALRYISVDENGVVSKVPDEGLPGMFACDVQVSVGDKLLSDPDVLKQNSGELHFSRSVPVNIQRVFGLQGDPIHPVKLYNVVRDLGGLTQVIRTRDWQTVRIRLGLLQTTSSSFALKKAYRAYFDGL